ncbi:MAG: hypothetical protein ABJH98_05785 [Reichenbachiella sp.]|uniref:hypothetical protein n=1 Tax=Reichenbachiella sp. TaxID=2184521 RepID=UPI003299906B
MKKLSVIFIYVLCSWSLRAQNLDSERQGFYNIKDWSSEDFNFGKGVLLASGYEVLQRKKWTMDVETRLFMSSVSLHEGRKREGSSFTLALGFTWF